MAKNILVLSCDFRETRAALIEDGIIAELHIERKGRQSSTVGNVYLGKVTRVLPGLQAAFIDIGQERAAFLHVEDLIRPDDFDEYLAGGRKLARGKEDGQGNGEDESDAAASADDAASVDAASREPGSNGSDGNAILGAPEAVESASAMDGSSPHVVAAAESSAEVLGVHEHDGDRDDDEEPFDLAEASVADIPVADPSAHDLGAWSLHEHDSEARAADSAGDFDIQRNVGLAADSSISVAEFDGDDDEDDAGDAGGADEVAPDGELLDVNRNDRSSASVDAAGEGDASAASSVASESVGAGGAEAGTSPSARTPGASGGRARRRFSAEPRPTLSDAGDRDDLLDGDDLPGFTVSEPGEPIPRAPSAPRSADDRGVRNSRRRRGRGRGPERGPASGHGHGVAAEPRGRGGLGRMGAPAGRGDARGGIVHPGGRDRRAGRPSHSPNSRMDAMPGRISKTTPIREVVREGQEIIVQVTKDPIGTKGARCSSHISLPGRYVVYFPTVDHIGISKRIGSDKERARLREAIEAMKPPSGGLIVRTVAEGLTKKGLKQDVGYLVRLWGEIAKKRETAKAPMVLSSELDLVLKVARDLFTDDVDEIVIDDKQQYERLCRFVEIFAPERVKDVKFYDEDEPIFDEYGIEDEI